MLTSNNRLQDNKIILDLLSKLVEMYPDQRFGQILSNYVIPVDVTDIFFPEGTVYINEMKKYINE